MDSIYLPSGYVDVDKLLAPKIFSKIFFVGPRGSGKSYGILKNLTVDHSDVPGFYVRTTKVELENLFDPELFPWGDLNMDLGLNYTIKKRNQNLAMITRTPESEEIICLCAALSTISQVRGMNARKYKYIFYDEFIPEAHVRKMRKQGEAVKQMYETLNRNRELQGEDPMRLILAANSNDINNDVLVEYGLVDEVLKMREKDIELKDFPERRLRIVYPMHSPIAAAKAETAGYKNESGDYSLMALGNQFVRFYDGNIKSLNLKDFDPLVRIGSLGIYKSKSNRRLYVSSNNLDRFPESFGLTDYELGRFRMKYHRMQLAYYKKRMRFESAACEIAFVNLWQK